MSNYTKIPNEILDSMADLHPAAFKLAMVLYRLTNGYHRNGTRASYRTLAEMTGLSVNGIMQSSGEIAHIFERQNMGGVTTWIRKNNSTPVQLSDTEVYNSVIQSVQLSDTRTIKENPKENNKEIDPLLDLVSFFAETAGVKVPNGQLTQRRDKWLDPMVTMYKAAGSDFGRTQRLITDTVRFLKDRGYKVVTPASIVKTATSMEFVKDSRGVSDV